MSELRSYGATERRNYGDMTQDERWLVHSECWGVEVGENGEVQRVVGIG